MKFLIDQIALPALTRLGTAVAGALVGAGLAAQHGPTIAEGTVILGLFAVDLATRKLVKR